ncbi:MAG: hypothetical protein QME47_07655, partial [Candidatus Thermoplasmatota archaeon]|nr:hypothetical protein [Candidatus Thermoplasmatota archaeon]
MHYRWDADAEQTASATPNNPLVIPAPEGKHILCYYAVDTVGNRGADGFAEVKVDTTKPTGFVIINGGAIYTSTTAVTLNLSAYDNVSNIWQMNFSNDSWATYSGWEDYNITKDWTLTSGDGEKVVSVSYRNYAGLVSNYSAKIILDTTPPTGTITIESDATYVTSLLVTLTLSASDTNGVAAMRFSNDGSTWSGWEAYNTSTRWRLTAGDGIKTVYAQYEDNAGLISTATISDTVILDTLPPTGTISINSGDTYTTSTSVTLTLSAYDANGINQMRFSNNGTTWSSWEAYATSRSWSLTAGDGTKIVYAQYKDNAGLVSTATIYDTIILDTTPPTSNITLPNEGAYFNTLPIQISGTCN